MLSIQKLSHGNERHNASCVRWSALSLSAFCYSPEPIDPIPRSFSTLCDTNERLCVENRATRRNQASDHFFVYYFSINLILLFFFRVFYFGCCCYRKKTRNDWKSTKFSCCKGGYLFDYSTFTLSLIY